jgi:hypothetical protein
MPELADKLEAARAEVARLERIASTATCRELGCDMQSTGGCNCGCHEDACCSVPVNKCTRCGDCDYGDNADATEIRRCCLEMYPENHRPPESWDDVEEGFDAGEWNNAPEASMVTSHQENTP